MEDAYIIRGGRPLKGEVRLSGAKNVALKVIIASLLFDREVQIANVPHIGDIADLIHLVNFLGGRARFVGRSEVTVDGTGLAKDTIPLLAASKTRVSFMMFIPLLHKLGRANIPNPGGCRIGSRPIDRTIAFMKAFGVKIKYSEEDGYYRAEMPDDSAGGRFRFDKPTHTGTEFALLFAALAPGESVIENICSEPEVDELIHFLNAAGAKIIRKQNVIYIDGISRLITRGKYEISSDRNEAATFAVFALATAGDVLVKPIDPAVIETFTETVRRAGGGVEVQKEAIRFFYKGPLAATDLTTAPHPGFMTDWQAPWAVLMTQADGMSTIHETVFENRFGYVDELAKLGARIEYFSPKVDHPETFYPFNRVLNECGGRQAIRIYGKTDLHNAVLNVSDLRAGASLLIAAAVASGESVVRGASVINRGYEAIDKKLRGLGAVIKKV